MQMIHSRIRYYLYNQTGKEVQVQLVVYPAVAIFLQVVGP